MKRVCYFQGVIWALCSILCPAILHAQYENVWAFGYGAGLDFNSGSPVAIKTSMDTREGCASLCNDQGQLLMYTDGETVWDRNNKVMPNATGLSGMGTNITSSTTQGAIIVPMPGCHRKFYVFSLGALGTAHVGKLSYSVIDMDLNNGLGDLSPGTKGKPLDVELSEQMTAVTGENCDVWLLVVSYVTGELKAYNVSASGVNHTPVISTGAAGTGLLGSVEVSPDRKKIALGQGNLILMDFDARTGKATNPLQLFRNNNYYGLCFSPNGSKLYASNLASLQQFDLNAGDSNQIRASKTLIVQTVSGVKRGPDGKVYTSGDGSHLHVIAKPDLPAADCQFMKNALALLPGTSHALGMPNTATIISNRNLYRSFTDTLTCAGEALLKVADTPAYNIRWEDGSSELLRRVTSPGRYRVYYEVVSPCMKDFITDTITVVPHVNRRVGSTQLRTGKCSTDTSALTAGTLQAADYIWQDGSRGPQYRTNKTGVYWVRYTLTDSCIDYVDSFRVTYPGNDPHVSFHTDTIICLPDILKLQNTSSSSFSSFNWDFGDHSRTAERNPEHQYASAGTYKVYLAGNIAGICHDTATVTIMVDAPVEHLSFVKSDSVICMGDGVQFTPIVDGFVEHLVWQMGDGNGLQSDNEKISHAYDRPGLMPVSLSAFFRACPDISFRDTVRVWPAPQIDLGADRSFCPGAAPLVLRNLLAEMSGHCAHHWSNGDTAESIRVTQPGVYTLSIESQGGCKAEESLKVHKDFLHDIRKTIAELVADNCYLDIPNAFSPNGDGVNDYFFPGKNLVKGVARFHLQIFSRWGELIYETVNGDGRGWDGRSNGRESAPGVYVYHIEIEQNDASTEQYNGSLTLLR